MNFAFQLNDTGTSDVKSWDQITESRLDRKVLTQSLRFFLHPLLKSGKKGFWKCLSLKPKPQP